MTSRTPLPSRPVADPRAVVVGPTYRITVLTDGLVRLEYSADGVFEDRASTFAVNRRPAGAGLPGHRDRRRTSRSSRTGSTSSTTAARSAPAASAWRCWAGSARTTPSGGTARSRPGSAAPRAPSTWPTARSRWSPAWCPGRASPSSTTPARWSSTTRAGSHRRDGSRTDLYVFAYGHDYPAAVAGVLRGLRPARPLLPRFALGNWWSRFHRYTAERYSTLIDRFDGEGIPFSVA